MSDEAHIINIDHLVLTGIDLRNSARTSALIESEVGRRLQGTELRTLPDSANEGLRVAAEVGRAVADTLRGNE